MRRIIDEESCCIFLRCQGFGGFGLHGVVSVTSLVLCVHQGNSPAELMLDMFLCVRRAFVGFCPFPALGNELKTRRDVQMGEANVDSKIIYR